MIKVRKSADTRLFFAKCDCTGLKGRWQCENTGPAAEDREEAKRLAFQFGWARISNRWYCQDCQRDHLAPKPAAEMVPFQPWH